MIRYRKLDVRPLFAKNVEPYPEIRKRIDALKENEGIELTVPFLPSPLIEKLKSEGFDATVEHLATGEWIVQFRRDLKP